MKLKATLSDRGIRVLEKGFLPTFEKLGKRLVLLLGPDDIQIIQAMAEAEGLHIAARLAKEVVFEPDTYTIESRCRDYIAFSCDIGLITKVLSSASINEALTIDIRLAVRTMTASEGQPSQQKPVLSFSWQGQIINMVQDLPISKPFPSTQVQELIEAQESQSMCPFYVDVQPQITELLSLVERLRNLSPEITLCLLRCGALHVEVQTPQMQVGWETRGLQVFPADVAERDLWDTPPDSQDEARPTERAQARLAAARNEGRVSEVVMLAKQLARALASSQLTGPAQLLLGIAGNSGFVHMLAVYCNPHGQGHFDDTISLTYKLPVRME